MISFIRKYVIHNIGLKLLSLILATGLWVMVSPDQEPSEVAVRAPIVFRGVPAHLEISSEVIPEAQIRVRGPERVLRQLRANDVHAELDLSGVQPGDRTFDLTAHEILHPRDLKVMQVVPGQVHLSFDTRMTRQVPISPRVIGNFLPGEEITQITADPAAISITGPSHHVASVESATTDPVDASGVTGKMTFTTNVYVSDPLVQVVQPTAIHVTVYVTKTADESH